MLFGMDRSTVQIAGELREQVASAAAQLRGADEAWARSPVAPGKWSPCELIGHLVDSASNNHSRFVAALCKDDLVFDPYDQDAWVEVQGYAKAPWGELLELFEGLNLQVARVMERAAPAVSEAPRRLHNLDRIAWETVPKDEPVSLAYFMRDYLGHLRAHLHGLDPALAGKPSLQRT